MPEWISELVEPHTLVTVAFVLFVLYLIVKAFLSLYPFLLKFTNLVHTLVGDDENPGIEKRMNAQTDKIDKIMHEVLPNHGSSLNDSVRRTEAQQVELGKRLEEHIRETGVWYPMLDVMYKDFNKKEE